MFSNNRNFLIAKIFVVICIVGVCLWSYFHSTKMNSSIEIDNNYLETKENNEDNNSDNTIVDDKIVDKDIVIDDSNETENSDNENIVTDEIIDKNINLEIKDVIVDKEIVDNNSKKIVLEDRSIGSNCAQAIEYFYEDSLYKYYFTCIKSSNMYVIVNEIEYKLVYALENKIITMEELEDNGYKFLKESKNLQIR